MKKNNLSLVLVLEEIQKEQDISELDWKDIKKGAKKFATGAALAGSLAASSPAQAKSSLLEPYGWQKPAVAQMTGKPDATGIKTQTPSVTQNIPKATPQINQWKNQET